MFLLIHFAIFMIAFMIIPVNSMNLDKRPIRFIWSYPAENCAKRGHDISPILKKYGIIQNSNKRFKGDVLQLLYNPGYYPYIKDGEFINGGLPLFQNLPKHLEITKAFFENTIPKNFSSLGTIDWEEWRPIWERNWGAKRIYQKVQRNKVKNGHPEWSDKEVENVAKYMFEEAAMFFMKETLDLANRMFPQSKWGFYLFPTCYGANKNRTFDNQKCNNLTRQQNDKLKRLWIKSTMLNPSIYYYESDLKIHHVFKANGIFQETLRIKKTYSPDAPIVPYVNLMKNYNKGEVFLNQIELASVYGMVVNFGFPGALMWGSSASVATEEKCKNLADNMVSLVGPYVKKLTDLAEECSKKHCSGNGRCYDKNFVEEKIKYWKSEQVFDSLLNPFKDEKSIGCRCYSKANGPNCDV